MLDMVVMGRARSIGLFSQPTAADFEAARAALRRVGIESLATPDVSKSCQAVSDSSSSSPERWCRAHRVPILDEPTSSLDLRNQMFILDKIRGLAEHERITVVFTTHQPHHAASTSDQVLLMMGEDACMFGPTDATMSEAALTSLFGVTLKRVVVEESGRQTTSFVPLGIE
ncbi:MAG: ABC transporter ATP-binding protein [Vicinamibacterales bacterium]